MAAAIFFVPGKVLLVMVNVPVAWKACLWEHAVA